MKKFYIVWNERIWTSNTHDTLKQAIKHKKELEKDNRFAGIKFIIMESTQDDKSNGI